MKIPRLLLSLFILSLFGLSSSFAWQEGGHYYSVQAVLAHLQGYDKNFPTSLLQSKYLNIVSFCAQLPDEAQEFDAIHLSIDDKAKITRSDYVVDNVKSIFRSDAEKKYYQKLEKDKTRADTIKQLLHGLTQGNAEVLRKVSEETVQAILLQLQTTIKDKTLGDNMIANNLCALGLAIHLFGDSYAHREFSNSGLMYATELGHFKDGTKPDTPFATDQRMKDWKEYMNRLAEILGGSLEEKFLQEIETRTTHLMKLNQPGTNGERACNPSGLVQSAFNVISSSSDASSTCEDVLIVELKSLLQIKWGDFNVPEEPKPKTPNLENFVPHFITALEDHGLEPCESYVDKVFDFGSIPAPLDCRVSWDIFQSFALESWAAGDADKDKKNRTQFPWYTQNIFFVKSLSKGK